MNPVREIFKLLISQVGFISTNHLKGLWGGDWGYSRTQERRKITIFSDNHGGPPMKGYRKEKRREDSWE